MAHLDGAVQVEGLRGDELGPQAARHEAAHRGRQPVRPQHPHDQQLVKVRQPLPVTCVPTGPKSGQKWGDHRSGDLIVCTSCVQSFGSCHVMAFIIMHHWYVR